MATTILSQQICRKDKIRKYQYELVRWVVRLGLLLLLVLSAAALCNGEEEELGDLLFEEMCSKEECDWEEGTKIWNTTQQTFSQFEVSGVNLALYNIQEETAEHHPTNEYYYAESSFDFELFEDFNIEDQITGTESWYDLIAYRQALERPSLSFYCDKVARKRWLPTRGYSQPHIFALKYAHELTASGIFEEEVEAIQNLLPHGSNYAVKPTHFSMTMGVWLVRQDLEEAGSSVNFSTTGRQLTGDAAFDERNLAENLAEYLHFEANEEGGLDFEESWALRNVEPGIVIEELFTDVEDETVPPLEFNIFTIWGKVWLAQMNQVYEQYRLNMGFFYRNGTVFPDTQENPDDCIPEWLDFSELVDIAERLGAHKDMFRVDIFVGVPAGTDSLQEGATMEERIAAMQIAVSESEIYPTTLFVDEEVCDEGARLWIAGYKMLNYRVVPNNEVPQAFLKTGSCPYTCESNSSGSL